MKAYAAFVELKAANGGQPWWEWTSSAIRPRRHRGALGGRGSLRGAALPGLAPDARAEEQFRPRPSLPGRAGIALMGDIPILMNEDSAEVWARRSIFRLGPRGRRPARHVRGARAELGLPHLRLGGPGAPRATRFWKERLAEADKYYSAYRIDHVLGFFRIWSLSERESTGYLGRFVPDAYIDARGARGLGFSPDRLRWLSEPHIRTARLVEAARET